MKENPMMQTFKSSYNIVSQNYSKHSKEKQTVFTKHLTKRFIRVKRSETAVIKERWGLCPMQISPLRLSSTK